MAEFSQHTKPKPENLIDKNQSAELIKQAWMIVQRLERISVDSLWARRASGYRGALLKWLDQNSLLTNITVNDYEQLQQLVNTSFDLLSKAARERTKS